MYPKCTKTRAVIHQRLFHDSSEFYVRILDIANLAFTSTSSPIITVQHKENLKKAMTVLEVSEQKSITLRNQSFSRLEFLGRLRLLCWQPNHNRRSVVPGFYDNINCKSFLPIQIKSDLSLFTKEFGFNIGPYRNTYSWYRRMKEISGFEECQEGAREFGDIVKAKLVNTFDTVWSNLNELSNFQIVNKIDCKTNSWVATWVVINSMSVDNRAESAQISIQLSLSLHPISFSNAMC